MALYKAPSHDSDGVVIEVKKTTDTTWTPIIGASGFTPSGGEPDVNERTDLQGKETKVGPSGAESATVEINGLQIAHPSYNILHDAWTGNTSINIRWRQPDDEILFDAPSGMTAAIATSGAITIAVQSGQTQPNAADSDDWGQGSALKIGTAYYGIGTLGANGVLNGGTVTTNPSSAEAAAAFEIVIPPVHMPSAIVRVMSMPVAVAPATAVSGTLTVQAPRAFPKLKVGSP